MKTNRQANLIIVTGLLTVGTGLLTCAAAPDQAAIARSDNAFAVDLYRELGQKEGNLLFSPYSISTAFGMTYAGAAGDTAQQMQRTLHLDADGKEAAAGYGSLQDNLNTIQKKGDIKLAVANSIWPEKTYPFRPNYLSLLEQTFKTSITPCDFLNNAEAERQTINQWVGKQTYDKIQNLLPSGSVNASTRMVLVNAVYFKGDWTRPFEEKATKPAPFFTAPNQQAQAPLMTQKARFGFAKREGFKVLAMPYKGNDLSMVVLLPDKVDGLAAIEQQLSADKLEAWTKQLGSAEVMVHFPKFKGTFGFSLNKAMTDLGTTDAFSAGKADFTGMSEKRDLFISAAVHKAFVEVNEKGTEAAAATGIMVATAAMVQPREPEVFRADHPFLYIIRHNQSGAILFLGRIADPTK